MLGVTDMQPMNEDSLAVGMKLRFTARGSERTTKVTAWEPPHRLGLTSVQGGVTATYIYALTADGNATAVTLKAACEATGFWTLLHPLIVFMMKRSDSNQLPLRKAALEE